MLQKTVKSTIAIILIITGIILTPMPVPFGIFLIVCGVALLATVNPKVRDVIRRLRKRFPKTSYAIHRKKSHLPKMLRRFLEDTDPH